MKTATKALSLGFVALVCFFFTGTLALGQTITGQKFSDLNGNGAWDAGEPALSGWTIQLSNGSNMVTDANGYYYFTDMLPGTYTVTEVQQTGWTQTAPTGGSYTVTLDATQFVDHVDFGNQPVTCMVASVSLNTGFNHPFNTVYAIGARDAFWRVVADPDSGTHEPRPATVITAHPAWKPAQPDSQWISSYPTAQDDLNGDYDFETRFCLRPGWTNVVLHICLRADDWAEVFLNGVNILQAGSATLNDGAWNTPSPICTNIDSTTYPTWFHAGENYLLVRVHNQYNVAMGLNLTGSVTGTGLALDRPDCCIPGASISGKKFSDLNGNGVWDSGEPFLAGCTVQLSNGSNTVTDALGEYHFMDLSSNTYTVTEVQQTGWTQTAPTSGSYTVTLDTDQSVDHLDFGNQPCIQIQCPSNIVVVSCTNVVVNYAATVTDICCSNATVVYTPASGSMFAPGVTPVHCVATDSCTNTASCDFTVTVLASKPVLSCTNLTILCGSPVPTNPPSVYDPGCSNVTVSLIGSGSSSSGCTQFIYQVWQAFDYCCTNSVICTQTVTVLPSVPILSCTNLTIQCGSPVPTNPPSVYDPCCNDVTVSLIGGGTNSNGSCTQLIYQIWQAFDYCCSNSTVCTQTVMVVDTTAPEIICASNKTVCLPPCPLGTNLPTETVLKSFTGASDDGSYPEAGLMAASDGMLYGTAWGGGSNDVGTVFRLNPDGSGYQVVHHFSGGDGINPHSWLIEINGALYGTAPYGGTSDYGTVYKWDMNTHVCTVLHDFLLTGYDGFVPYSGLLVGSDGMFYGVTDAGGTNALGTVYKIKTDGTDYSQLHHFPDPSYPYDGYHPYDERGLVQGIDGMLYGTTYEGGSNDVGTVFTLGTNGSSYTILHHFATAGYDGQKPIAGLLIGTDGMLYGTTYFGGTNGFGTVFRLNTNGTSYAVLHHFGSIAADGQNPYYTLVVGCDEMLYGTTYNGGTSSNGTVFRLNPDGSGYARLYSFAGGPGDGAHPITDLLIQNGGTMYGTTRFGGANGLGTVFRLNWGWYFDRPTVTDECCSNVNVTILSTVTTSNGCSESHTRTWQASDCCSNSAACSQTVTVVHDTTAPTLTACLTNWIVAGRIDNFGTLDGPEPASPSTGCVAHLTNAGYTLKGFDDCTVNRAVAHTFANLPGCLTEAHLIVRLKPCGDICDNDTFGIWFTDPTSTNGTMLPGGWSRYLGSGNPQPGLWTNNWCTYTNGVVTNLDLSALPLAGGGTADLLPLLNDYGFFDFVCQDDTAVDYLELQLTSCCCDTNVTMDCAAHWGFKPPTAQDDCCSNVTV
ncbi:MAG: choice-of-anchor tandem repeat GloVer-containing protein, partial [Verrucomicrobiia bacterium]